MVVGGSWAGEVAVNPVTNRVYVSNYYGGFVSVIDGFSNTVSATVAVGYAASSLAINPTANRIYVTHTTFTNSTNYVSVIDGTTNAVATVSLSNEMVTLGVNPVTGRIYATSIDSDSVSVLDGATNAVVATVPLAAGSQPFGVAVNPVTGLVYVTQIWQSVGGTVSVIADGQPLSVAIDIKPGSFRNRINPRSRGKIPVAILTTDTFDAATVDPTTVLFGRTGTEAIPVRSALRDVDGDGDTDMILRFNTRAMGIQCGDTSASLTAVTLDGQMIQGSDAINTVRCK